MKIIIPATGIGKRFIGAGYENTKPLVDVTDNKKIIDYVIDMFDSSDEFIFIIGETTYDDMVSYLSNKNIKSHFIKSSQQKLGPVGAITSNIDELNKYVSDSDEVIISYCDFGMEWDYKKFKEFIKENNIDASVPCYTGYHPHLLNKDNVYAVPVLDGNTIIKMNEKFKTDEPELSFHSPGVYYFKNFGKAAKAFSDMTDEDKLNGEFYVSLSYNNYIQLFPSDKVEMFTSISRFYQFGTPADFEYAKKWINEVNKFKVNFLNFQYDEYDNVVCLAAGRGSRFKSFNVPKPFLPIKDVEYSNLRSIVDIIVYYYGEVDFVAALDHKNYWDNSSTDNISYVEPNEIGAAYSYLNGAKHIEGKTLIIPCDLLQSEHVLHSNSESDFNIFVSEGTLTQQQNPNAFTWVKVSENDPTKIIDIAIKEQPDESYKHILNGSFLVNDNQELIKLIEECYSKNITTNGEIYLDNVFKYALDSGINVKCFDVGFYLSYGTPSEYKESNYWT